MGLLLTMSVARPAFWAWAAVTEPKSSSAVAIAMRVRVMAGPPADTCVICRDYTALPYSDENKDQGILNEAWGSL